MKPRLFVLWLLVSGPLAVHAQQIPVKTVPVATGNQFLLFPSVHQQMGGVSIALEDPLYDPFVNPARGTAFQGLVAASMPAYYSVTLADSWNNDASFGRTLPIGILGRRGAVFGGAVVAWQELSQRTQSACCFRGPAGALDVASLPPDRRSTSNNNLYLTGLAGARIPGTGLSIGAGVFAAGLNGLEGVQLLYFDGDRVEQSGTMTDIRVGLYQRWKGGRRADLVVAHHRLAMDHEMLVWDPAIQDLAVHTERDETLGWAVQTTLLQPLSDGWRIGGLLAGDWKRHPKIPNYDVMQIPRDPGNSSAYNVGVGVARIVGPATFGLDVIYEPIWSHTWADALEDTRTTGEGPSAVIPAGDKTIENFFRFDNTRLRLGVRREGKRFEIGFGVDVHTFRYDLDQENFVEQTVRTLDESWSEWTGSLGLALHFAEFDIRYLGLLTLGTGRPGVSAVPIRSFEDAASADFVIAPGGALTLQDARVWAHQVTLLVPLSD